MRRLQAEDDTSTRATMLWVGLAATLWYLAFSAAHYFGGDVKALDFGYYLQAIAMIAHGTWNPIPALYPTHTFLADNLSFYAYPMALLYRAWSSPWLLLVIQASWLGGIAALVLEYAKRTLPRWAYWVSVVLVLTYPAAIAIAWTDFHFDALGGLLGLLVMFALKEGKTRRAALFAVAAFLVKEDAALAVMAASVWVWLGQDSTPTGRRAAPWFAVAAVVVFVLNATVIMPALSPAHAATMTRVLFGTHGTLGEIRASLQAITWPQKAVYLAALLIPLGGLPLVAWRRLPAIAIAIAVNLAALDTFLSTGGMQYNAFTLPFILLAAIEGLAIISQAKSTARAVLATLLLGGAVLVGESMYSWPIAQAYTAAVSATQTWPAIVATEEAVRGSTVLGTDIAAGYLAQSPTTHVFSLFDYGTYLEHLRSFVGYPRIVVTRSEQRETGHEINALIGLLQQNGYHVILRNSFAVVLAESTGATKPEVAYGPWHRASVAWHRLGSLLRTKVSLPSGIWDIRMTVGDGGHGTVCADLGKPIVCDDMSVLSTVAPHTVVVNVPPTDGTRAAVNLTVYVTPGTPAVRVAATTVRVRKVQYTLRTLATKTAGSHIRSRRHGQRE